jgi:uncharacterized protein YecE (DUF72 family)
MNLLFLLLSPALGSAHVPYGELEHLRQLSVVTRVVMDDPSSSPLPSCPPRDKTLLGQRLALAFANQKPGWKTLKVEKEDLEKLDSKINQCEARGSCEVYEEFLNEAQSSESAKNKVAALQKGLEAKLSGLESSSYTEALKTVKNACLRLRELEKE